MSFDVAVLEKYRGAAGFSLMRTNTVGRVKREGCWTDDHGDAEILARLLELNLEGEPA